MNMPRMEQKGDGIPEKLPAKAQQRFLALSAAAAELGGCTSQAELFRGVGRRLHELGLETLIYMRNPDGQTFRAAYNIGMDLFPQSLRTLEELLGRPWYEGRNPLDVPCALTATFHDGQIRLVESMIDDMVILFPALAGKREVLEPLFPSWRAIYAPLNMAGHIVGVLVVFSDELSDEDRPVLGAFANLLGALLESVRRLEAERRHREQLEFIHRFTSAVNAAPLNLPDLARAVERALMECPHFEFACLGVKVNHELVFPSSGVRKPIMDVSEMPATIPASLMPGARSVLSVPLAGESEEPQVAGVLSVGSRQANAFDEEDRDVVHTLAQMLVPAIRNVLLFERVDRQLLRRIAELQTLVEIGQTVTSKLEPNDVLLSLLNTAARALDAEWGVILLVDTPARQIYVAQITGPQREKFLGQRGPLTGLFTEHFLSHPQAICIPDVSAPGWHTPYFDTWKAWGATLPRSFLSTPLLRGEHVIGTLSLCDKRHGTFGAEDLELIRAIALWASIALENAQLYQASLEKSAALERALSRLGQTLTSGHELQATLDLVLELAMELISADAGAIQLLNKNGTQLEFSALRNFPESFKAAPLPVKGSLTGQVIHTGEPVASEDAWNDPRIWRPDYPKTAGMRSLVAVPLRTPQSNIGTLTLYRHEVRPFSSREIALLQSFADQAAMAIEKARLVEKISEQATYLDAILSTTRESILVITAAGKIEYANQAAQQILGEIKPGTPVSGFSYLATPAEVAYLRKIWRRVLAGDLSAFEVEITDIHGMRRRVLARLSPLVPRRRYVLLAIDVTEERRLEQRRLEFLRNLHHELRTPLAAVLGFTQILQEREHLTPEKQRMCAERTHQAASRLKKLLDDLQSYTLLAEPLSHESDAQANLADIIARVLHEARRNYPNARFMEHMPAALPCIACEPAKLEQVVRHLVDNAAKFSPEGARVEIRAWMEDRQVRFSVRDEGIGIDPLRLQEIFDSFHQLDDQLDRHYEGLGVGLALVRRIVEAAGGTIDVKSEPGRGSTFTVTLPAATP